MLTIIAPEPGPFREQIQQPEEKIQAYAMLEKNNNKKSMPAYTKKKKGYKIEQKLRSNHPQIKKISIYKTKNLENKILYYNNKILIENAT